MANTIFIQNGEMLRRAFCKGAPERAEPGDTLVLTSIIALDQDLIFDVPVTIAFDGTQSGIDCNGHELRVRMEGCEDAERGVVTLVHMKRHTVSEN